MVQGFIKKIKSFYKQQSVFQVSILKQNGYLLSLKDPLTDIERSFNQFKCQLFLSKKYKNIILNFISFFLILPLTTYLYIKAFFYKGRTEHADAVYVDQGVGNVLPSTVIEKYPNLKFVEFSGSRHLTYSDIKIILKLYIKYWPYSFFTLKIILKIGRYRNIIDLYQPKHIVVASEYSFTSSVLTHYSELNGIEHINIMHGEKLFYIRDSFFRFHICYIWDEHYEAIFNSLRAYKGQFKVAFPSFFDLQLNERAKGNSKPFLLTYYLGAETYDELKQIKNCLQTRFRNTRQVAIRPHPRYTSLNFVKEIFDDFTIEDPANVSIRQSFIQTEALASLYSTVLYQAKINNKEYYLDDLSNKEKYSRLRELNYLLISQPHKKLSEITLIG